MVLGDAVLTLDTFEWVSRSITWSLFILKASNLHGQMTTLVIFYVVVSRGTPGWCQFIWNSSQFPCTVSEWPLQTADSGLGIKHGLRDKTLAYLLLRNRVRGPYCNLRTEFFPFNLWPKRVRAINRRGKLSRIRSLQYEWLNTRDSIR